MRRVHHLGCLPFVVLAGCSAGAGPQSRLLAVHNAYEAVGLGSMGHVAEASLGEGGTSRFPMELETQCYAFAAIGGDGVRGIEISVLDANNRSIASHESHDAQSALQFCPTARGRYTVVVRMAQGSGAYAFSSWRGTVRGAGNGGGSSGSHDGEEASCGNPIPLTVGQTVTGDTTHLTNRTSGSCGGDGNAAEAVYSLTVERRQLVTFAAQETFDGIIYVRRECDDAESEIGCNDDDNDVRHSRLGVVLDPGHYSVFVDGLGDQHGSYTLAVTGTDVPTVAQVCGAAPALAVGQAVTGTTRDDPNVFTASCANHAPGPDHVFRLEVPQESRVRVSQESDYDGALYLRRACADEQSEVACNDDAGDTQHSRINATLPQGTYYVFTDGFQPGSQGNFTIQADLAPADGGGAPGDTCADALPLVLGTPVDGDTFTARDDVTASCTASADGYDVVYRFDVTNRSRVKLWLDGGDLAENASLVLSRTCGRDLGANQVVECREHASGESTAIDTTLDRGHYFVTVDSATPRAFGRFHLNSHVQDLAAMEARCRAAPLLHPGQVVSGTTRNSPSEFESTCAGNSRSNETLYRLVLRRRSTVRLTLESQSFDTSLYVRSDCLTASSERACNDDDPDTRHSHIETTLDAGTYTVFVDGFSNGNAGDFTLRTEVVNP